MTSSQSIAQVLPDLPRWVEVRDLLLAGKSEIFGIQAQAEPALVLREPNGKSVFVIGQAPVAALQAAMRGLGQGDMVIAAKEQAIWLGAALPGWTRTRIIVHTLPDLQYLPSASPSEVKFLDANTLDWFPIPSELLQELKEGAEHSVIAATWVNQQPVSFCYAASETESWWDIAIDTLPEYRRQGYAALCVAYMIRYMLLKGKQPVWQAEENNSPSRRLAQKLGFVPMDELALFTFHEQAKK